MMLQALAAYHDRLAQQDASDLPAEGFEKKEIPFIIVLTPGGQFAGIQDTRTGEGKKKQGRLFTVPKSVKRTVGIAANLLWDNPAYVLGVARADKEKDPEKLAKRTKEQHEAFVQRIREACPEPRDQGVQAVLHFLEAGDFTALKAHPLWPEVEAGGPNISFQLQSDNMLVCQRPEVLAKLVHHHPTETAGLQPCLVTGNLEKPVVLHTAIKGVWGAQSSGANIVSFNLDAFNSFCKTQGHNAPVGEKAEFAYTTALNGLLAKGSRQRIQVGDASTVFWAARPNKMESWFGDFFGDPPAGQSQQDLESIKALFSAPRTGALPLDEDRTPFFVLGLAPNAARIAVRFWYAGTVGEVARCIRQHFDDISIVHGPGQPDYLSLFRLLVSTAIQGDSKNIQPRLAGQVMEAILEGTPYPQTLLAAVVSRARAEQSRKDQNGNPMQNVTYPRAALIKAILVRGARYYNQNEKEASLSLDTTNTNPGYLLGRLFAVLERTQEAASPGINATIRDRFYGAASSTPVAVFPHLLKLKNFHIGKLENRGQAVNLEKLIGEIIYKLLPESPFPPHLSLPDQGRFAVGYYHQRQDFFTKKDTTPTTDTKENNA